MLTILTGVCIFLIITLALVIILLIAKKYLVHSGKVTITINGDTTIEADSGKSLLSTFADHNIFLSSACGGKGSCGQCKCQVFEGAATYCPPRRYTSRARNSKTTGVWDVRSRSRKTARWASPPRPSTSRSGSARSSRTATWPPSSRSSSSPSRGCPHGLHPRLVCPDQDSRIRDGL